jgi:hypothetical protein
VISAAPCSSPVLPRGCADRRRRPSPGPHHDEGGESLAILGVGDSDHAGLVDVGCVVNAFDLDGMTFSPPDTIISSSRPTTNSRPAVSR